MVWNGKKEPTHNGIDAVHVSKEMHDVLRPRQQREIALDDDPVETVVDTSEQAAKQRAERFHRSSPFVDLVLTPRSLNRGPVEIHQPDTM